MSVVDYKHRTGGAPAQLEAYSTSIAAIREHLLRLGWVRSLLICGSYVKANLAPGWSDIDLVAFYDGPLTPDRIEESRLFGDDAPNPSVPVGFDLVNIEQFKRTRHLGGRPLAMTFELQKYALTSFGPHAIDLVEQQRGDDETIAIESAFHVRADANSWVRRSVHGYASERERLFDAAKTLLRIAMFESSPYAKATYTVESYCDAVLRHTRNADLERCFAIALQLRRNWTRLNSDAGQESGTIAILSDAIIWYFESWEPHYGN